MTKKCAELQIYFGSLNELFTVSVVPAKELGSNKKRILRSGPSFTLTKMTKNEIKVQFNFTNPLAITTDDKVEIFVNFGLFDKGLPKDTKIKLPATRQLV